MTAASVGRSVMVRLLTRLTVRSDTGLDDRHGDGRPRQRAAAEPGHECDGLAAGRIVEAPDDVG